MVRDRRDRLLERLDYGFLQLDIFDWSGNGNNSTCPLLSEELGVGRVNRLTARFYAELKEMAGMSCQIENIDQMRERHKREIKRLQKSCKHKKLSKWMEEYWAPGHSTGSMVKLCDFCGKVVKRKGLKFEL